jgi:hypothetical protein
MGGEQLANVPGIFALLVDLRSSRCDLLLGEAVDQLADVLELLGDLIDPGTRRRRFCYLGHDLEHIRADACTGRLRFSTRCEPTDASGAESD